MNLKVLIGQAGLIIISQSSDQRPKILLLTMRIQKKLTTYGGACSSRFGLPVVLAATVVLCTYLLTSHFEKSSYSSQYLRPTTATKTTSPFGFVIPEGRAVALPSVRIDAEESSKIDRKIYGGDGGE